MAKVFVGMVVPSMGMMYSKTFISLLGMQKPDNATFFITRGNLMDWERNNLVMEMLKDKDASHLFLVDADVIMPQDGLMRMMKDEKDIVTGLYFQRPFPHSPVAFKKSGDKYVPFEDYKQNELNEIDAAGTGCLLIRREVLEKMKDKLPKQNGVPQFFTSHPGLSDDSYFFEKAKETGFKTFVDTNVKCGHVEMVTIGEFHFQSAKNSK